MPYGERKHPVPVKVANQGYDGNGTDEITGDPVIKMQIIAIVNEKGGSGKTTTAVNLSAALGELNQKVLLVDLDGQAASSRWLGIEDDNRFADALWAGEGLNPIPDVIPGVSLAPGSGKLDSVAHDLRPTQGGQLRKLLLNTTGFEYVIIDCPPSLGNKLIGNALLAATHAIVPVETSILALDGLKILLTTLQDIRDGFDHDIILKGVVACRFDARTKLSRFILTELKRALPGKVFNTVIRENVSVRECPASGKSILEYASDSHAAEDYRALARELLDNQDRDTIDTGATEKIDERELTQEEYDEVRKQTDDVRHFSDQKQDEQTSTSAKPESEIYNEKYNAGAEPTVTIETQQDHQANEQSNIDQVRKQAEAMLGKFAPKPAVQTPTPTQPESEIHNEECDAAEESEPPVTIETQQDQQANEQPELDKPEPPEPLEPTTPPEPPATFEPPSQDNGDVQFDREPTGEKDHVYDVGINEKHEAASAVAVLERALAKPKHETRPEKEEPAGDDTADKQQAYPALRAILQKMNKTTGTDDPAT